jgi:hypothetical protein
MFRNFIKKLHDLVGTRRNNKPQGATLQDKACLSVKTHILFELLHDDGTQTDTVYHNIVTKRASVLIAKLLAMHADTSGITHIALGLGDPFGTIPDNLNDGLKWECDNPPAAPTTGGRQNDAGKPILVNELARKRVDVKHYQRQQ